MTLLQKMLDFIHGLRDARQPDSIADDFAFFANTAPAGNLAEQKDVSSTALRQPVTEKQLTAADITKQHLAALPPDTVRSIADDKSADTRPPLLLLPLKEPQSIWRTIWLKTLAQRCSLLPQASALSMDSNPSAVADQATVDLIKSLFDSFDSLAEEFNGLVDRLALRVVTTSPDSFRKASLGKQASDNQEFQYRFRASTISNVLSVRGKAGVVEFFLVPIDEAISLSYIEPEAKLKVRLRLEQDSHHMWWTLDRLPINDADLKSLVRNLFRELVSKSADDEHGQLMELSALQNLDSERLSQAVKQLILERQNLVQKIVIQQEEIQKRIARDLHDAVIADIMLLKRLLTEQKLLPDNQLIEILDRVTVQLREICHDLAPRDLKDWGLQTLIEDMLERVANRLGADYTLYCDSDIPPLPHPVELHIFRIVQECLTNIEKYSKATKVSIIVEATAHSLKFVIEDNGQGFRLSNGAHRTIEGGQGMGSLNERAELIRAFYPTKLVIQSEPESGSRTTLIVSLSGSSH